MTLIQLTVLSRKYMIKGGRYMDIDNLFDLFGKVDFNPRVYQYFH